MRHPPERTSPKAAGLRTTTHRLGAFILGHVFVVAHLFIVEAYGAPPQAGAGMAVVRDSAGVRIVESAEPRWRAGNGWRVGSTPRFTIGDQAGDRRYELHRVTGALRLSDGRIVVANAGAAQLRLYSARGEHLRDIGRRGSGPGEFDWIHGIWPALCDSVLIFDPGQRRVSVISPRGDFVRSFQPELSQEHGIPSIAANFADGSLVSIGARGMPHPAALGFVTDNMFAAGPGLIDGLTWTFARYTPTGSYLNGIGEVRESPRWRGSRIRYLPFSIGAPVSAAGEALLYLGNGSAFEVEVRTSDGALAQILRWRGRPREVTRNDVARFRSAALERTRDENHRRDEERWLDEVHFPDRMPAYQSVLIDALGHLWVEQYRAPWEKQPRWWIFDPDGSWLGEVATPAGFMPRQIGRDYLLALGRGEDDVEIVALFPLYR